MTPSSIASLVATLFGLACSIWLFAANSGAQGLQDDLQKHQQELQNQQLAVQAEQQKLQVQQEQIQTANTLSQQVGPQVLRDLAQRAVTNKDEKIRGLLSKYNLNIQENAEAGKGAPATGGAPASTPAPKPQ